MCLHNAKTDGRQGMTRLQDALVCDAVVSGIVHDMHDMRVGTGCGVNPVCDGEWRAKLVW